MTSINKIYINIVKLFHMTEHNVGMAHTAFHLKSNSDLQIFCNFIEYYLYIIQFVCLFAIWAKTTAQAPPNSQGL